MHKGGEVGGKIDSIRENLIRQLYYYWNEGKLGGLETPLSFKGEGEKRSFTGIKKEGSAPNRYGKRVGD